MKQFLSISIMIMLSSCLDNNSKEVTCTKGHYETYRVYYARTWHENKQWICDEEMMPVNNQNNNSSSEATSEEQRRNSIPREISEEEAKYCDGC